jgi:hypothetical protein
MTVLGRAPPSRSQAARDAGRSRDQKRTALWTRRALQRQRGLPLQGIQHRLQQCQRLGGVGERKPVQAVGQASQLRHGGGASGGDGGERLARREQGLPRV